MCESGNRRPCAALLHGEFKLFYFAKLILSLPTYENSVWSIMAISFISLLVMSAILGACFFVRRHRIGWDIARPPQAR